MMGVSVIERPSRLPAPPEARGYHATYRAGEVNHCPGCGRSHWHVGRLMAECGFCATALPLTEAGMTGCGAVHRQKFEEAA